LVRGFFFLIKIMLFL